MMSFKQIHQRGILSHSILTHVFSPTSQVSLKGLARIFCATVSKNTRTLIRERAVKRERELGAGRWRFTDDDFKASHVTQSMRINGTANITTVQSSQEGTSEQRNEMNLNRDFLAKLNNHFSCTERNLRNIESNVNSLLNILREKDITREMRELRLEWHVVAMTLDRLFFLIFIIAIVSSLIVLFPRPYGLQF